jgi:cytochrome P450
VVTGLGRLVRDGPLRVGDYAVASGIEVTPSIETIHADPASYPDPGDFRPERFLDDPGPAAWLPYGGGTRRCLGAAFASFEMRIVLARVLERTRLRPVGRPWPQRRRRVTPPTRHAFARALRRGRRSLPARGSRVTQVATPKPA